MKASPIVREICEDEHQSLGDLMVDVYSKLEGFPSQEEQPEYYEMLENIGRFGQLKGARVLVAVLPDGTIVGGVVYFGDMSVYGSGGKAPSETRASGIRLLGVDMKARGLGVGRALTNACIQRAQDREHSQVILHTTRVMATAWAMYEKIGFARSPDLDFVQEGLPVFGFRLHLGAK